MRPSPHPSTGPPAAPAPFTHAHAGGSDDKRRERWVQTPVILHGRLFHHRRDEILQRTGLTHPQRSGGVLPSRTMNPTGTPRTDHTTHSSRTFDSNACKTSGIGPYGVSTAGNCPGRGRDTVRGHLTQGLLPAPSGAEGPLDPPRQAARPFFLKLP